MRAKILEFREIPKHGTQLVVFCELDRKIKTLIVPHYIDVVKNGVQAWARGELLQNALSFLSVDEREFLLSGLYAHEWEKLFGDEE